MGFNAEYTSKAPLNPSSRKLNLKDKILEREEKMKVKFSEAVRKICEKSLEKSVKIVSVTEHQECDIIPV